MSNQTHQKQRLPYTKRHILPIRLEQQDHAELIATAKQEQRSMSFIAMRRYQAGLKQEQSQQPK